MLHNQSPIMWTNSNQDKEMPPWHPLEIRPTCVSVTCSPLIPVDVNDVNHEIGFHMKVRPMSVGRWIHEQQQIWKAPRHNFPIRKVINLQRLCLDTIHRCYRAVKTNYYHLNVCTSAPYMACNVYTYHVCYKDPEYLDCLLTCYDVTVYVKYGFHPLSNAIQNEFHKERIVEDPSRIIHAMAYLQRYLWCRTTKILTNRRYVASERARSYSYRQHPRCNCVACRIRQAFCEQAYPIISSPPLFGWLCTALEALTTNGLSSTNYDLDTQGSFVVES